ncbi:MAG: bifunctional DNA primase/polymerase, partial [Lachnospiraceae bacterium]|nr:bifunctional DNA primase/polymerase [Lachnospiraceae bacterium]
MASNFDFALAYALGGWSVFPCHHITPEGVCSCGRAECASPGKHPRTPHGHKDATTDPKTIERWWAAWPDANIGFRPPEGLVVLDFDGEEGLRTLERLRAEGLLPASVEAKSGGGGSHLFFLVARPLPNRTKVLPGLDLRTSAGFIILPPSNHASGGVYSWLKGHNPAEVQMAEMPAALYDLLADKGEAAEEGLDWREGDLIAQGQRDSTLFKIASRLRGQRGADKETIAAKLAEINRDCCRPPLSKRELTKIVNSVMKYPAQGSAALDFAEDAPERGRLLRAADVVYEEPQFLIAPYVQRGVLHLLQGDPAAGKTSVVCGIAALVSTGRPLLDIPTGGEPQSVLILSCEDAPSVLRGRLEASGADLARVYLLESAGVAFGDPIIEAKIKETGAALVIFDPLQSYMGGKIDLHRSNETRPILDQLAAVAQRTGAAVVLVCHLSKGAAAHSPALRSLGSVDLAGAARSILHVAGSPSAENEKYIFHLKSSQAPRGATLSFSIGAGAGIEWRGFSPLTVEDLAAAQRRKER